MEEGDAKVRRRARKRSKGVPPAERAVQWTAPALAVLQVDRRYCRCDVCMYCKGDEAALHVRVPAQVWTIAGELSAPLPCYPLPPPHLHTPPQLQPYLNPRLVYQSAASVPLTYWSPGEDELLGLGGCESVWGPGWLLKGVG